jgi:hypothetical protein
MDAKVMFTMQANATTTQPAGIFIYNNTSVRVTSLYESVDYQGMEIYNNIADAEKIFLLDQRDPWSTRIDVFDYNLYSAETFYCDTLRFEPGGEYYSFTEWQSAFSSGRSPDVFLANPDLHSLQAQPRFVDPSAHDYRLQSGSPGWVGRNGVHMGAYPIGNELIGPSWSLTVGPSPHTVPGAPRGLCVR